MSLPFENPASPRLRRFASLLEPASPETLESMARQSQTLTRNHFGRTIRLFAPLYLSNECVNNCAYCGFSRDNPILRVTLSEDAVLRERVAAMAVHAASGEAVRITVSAGLTEHHAGETIDQALSRAQLALREAKAQGRNRMVVG